MLLQEAKEVIPLEWEKVPIEIINQYCEDITHKLEQIIEHEGSNNFHSWPSIPDNGFLLGLSCVKPQFKPPR